VGDQARVWLAQEGVVKGVHVTGDVMLDAALTYREAGRRTQARRRLGPDGPPYAVVTCHRAENTDRPERLAGIIEGLERVATQIKTLIVAHPRTRQALQRTGLSFSHPGISVIDPVGYLDMLDIESGASVIITDSGGVQKEAYFCGVPCVTLRDETEWLETLEGGWNQLAGADPVAIAGLTSEALKRIPLGHPPSVVFGDGKASQKIAGIILNPPC
jgi:UDP-GlcNAc3NAcA epimerase